MTINATDFQIVGETENTLFGFIQPSSTPTAVFLTNNGANTINYRFQDLDDGTWTDEDTTGTPLNGALIPGQSIAVLITSTATQIRAVGNASGGSRLDFSVTRQVSRSSGGNLPILGGL